MIYINDTSGTITIPKHIDGYYSSGYTVVLSSNLSDKVTIVENGSDISTNPLYYKFALYSLARLNVGEYTYKLYGANFDNVLETGLLTYGEFNREVIVNNTTVKEKIQYNPNITAQSNVIKQNTYYYGFAANVEGMLSSANTKTVLNEQRTIYNATSNVDDSKFYVLYSSDTNRTTPIEFTCGGAPMVMTKSQKVINSTICEVWESGEIYPVNTTLTIISINE